MIVSSVLLGLWFAERLSRPIGRLTGAAQKIAEGELNVGYEKNPVMMK